MIRMLTRYNRFLVQRGVIKTSARADSLLSEFLASLSSLLEERPTPPAADAGPSS